MSASDLKPGEYFCDHCQEVHVEADVMHAKRKVVADQVDEFATVLVKDFAVAREKKHAIITERDLIRMAVATSWAKFHEELPKMLSTLGPEKINNGSAFVSGLFLEFAEKVAASCAAKGTGGIQ